MSPAASLEDALARSRAVRAVRQALRERAGVWIVGGAIRDALLGRDVTDLDLAVDGEADEVARAVARAAEGHPFELSDEFATWRVQARRRPWHIDVAELRGESIETDLEARDFAVNAMAVPLGGGELLDPFGGADDLERRVLRAVGERSFADDPLRIMRAARLAAALGLSLEPATVGLARGEAHRAAEPAGERQFVELRGIVTGPDPVRGIGLMDELGATPVVLPELDALRGVEQNPYHHLDVHGHTIEVLERTVALEADPGAVLGEVGRGVDALLAERLGDELTRAGGLRFAALFHDLGKPETRSVAENGRILFIGHDEAGARIIRGICSRLRISRRLAAYLKSLTLNHLRLGFLVHERPLSRRRVYEYLKATEPETVDVTLLTVADRLATQGPRTREVAIDAHLELAREMVAEGLAWRRTGPPAPPLRGDELARELGIEPGPELGRLLGEIEAAQFAGEVESRDDAVALARRLLSGRGLRRSVPLWDGTSQTPPSIGSAAVEASSQGDCLFCGIVAGDVPAQIVDSDEHTVAFMDINPATRGHALVVPRRHAVDLFDVSDDDLAHTMAAARRLARRMEEALEPDGYNILNSCRPAAWQTLFHYHLHVIPRYEDDPLKLPWIPRAAEADEIVAIADRIRG